MRQEQAAEGSTRGDDAGRPDEGRCDDEPDARAHDEEAQRDRHLDGSAVRRDAPSPLVAVAASEDDLACVVTLVRVPPGTAEPQRPRKASTPAASRAASACRPSGELISAASVALRMFPHST